MGTSALIWGQESLGWGQRSGTSFLRLGKVPQTGEKGRVLGTQGRDRGPQFGGGGEGVRG